MGEYFLGLDAGSSITKAAVFDHAFRQVGEGAFRITLLRPRPGWSEIDPDSALQAATEAIGAALRNAKVDPEEIAALGISAAMVGAWLVDAEGNALRPGITWEDSRSQPFLDHLVSQDTQLYHRVFEANGCVLQQGCTLPVMRWLKDNEPEMISRAAHVISYKDFLRAWLTGRIAADKTEASVAPGDARLRSHSSEMLALFGIADFAAKLPVPLESEALAGELTEAAASMTGLRRGMPVAIGAGDVPSTVIGAGAVVSGRGLAIIGTTSILGFVSDQPVFTPRDLGLQFTLPGNHWFRAMVNVAGTINLDWAVNLLAPELVGLPDLYERLETLVAEVEIGSEGVVFLPYLSESGIIAPVVNVDARAGFQGLTPRHDRRHMLRAVYEGVMLAMRDLGDQLSALGDEVHLTGGAARSRFWSQMLADALNKHVVVPAGTEFGARGAALIAATAIGRFRSVSEASVFSRGIERRHAPNEASLRQWDKAFARYKAFSRKVLT